MKIVLHDIQKLILEIFLKDEVRSLFKVKLWFNNWRKIREWIYDKELLRMVI